ncbi:MAG: 4Fe-4S dicluster domain-containing protein [Desulfonatronovibrionaceae bacterium]
MFIKANFDLCTGCRMCQLACSEKNFGGYNPRFSLLRIDPTPDHLCHFPVPCNQCSNPFCARVCPVGAISKDDSTQTVLIDQETCIGCGLCAKYCPVGVIIQEPEGKKFVKCDLCSGDPVCVSACPTGALELADTGGGNE